MIPGFVEEFPIRRNQDGTISIPTDVDLRIRRELTDQARQYGLEILLAISNAIVDRRGTTTFQQVSDHYGEDFGYAVESIGKLVHHLDAIIYGFSRWLNASGFGNDLIFVKAMFKWSMKFNDMHKRSH